jgi:hypothetical protein
MSVEIHRTGDADWPRYFLTSQTPQGIRYWNGTEWANDFGAACVYAFLPEVCREFERLLLAKEREHFVQEFEATVRVKLHSNQPMTEREMARYLDRFADLFLPMDGPTDDSLIQAEIHWHELKKRPGQKACDSSGE